MSVYRVAIATTAAGEVSVKACDAWLFDIFKSNLIFAQNLPPL